MDGHRCDCNRNIQASINSWLIKEDGLVLENGQTINMDVIESNEIINWIRDFDEVAGWKFQITEKLLCVTSALSSILPSLPQDLMEIDDILYPRLNDNIYLEGRLSEHETVEGLIYICYKFFLKHYYSFKRVSLLATTFLQMTNILSKNAYIHHLDNLMAKAVSGLTSASDVCFSLKLLRLIFNKKREATNCRYRKLLRGQNTPDILFLFKLKNFPHDDTDRNKITLWIAHQASLIIYDMDIGLYKKYFNLETKLPKLLDKGCLEECVCLILKNLTHGVHLDYLYKFFTTAQDENEKRERMEAFFKGCIKYTQDWDKSTFYKGSDEKIIPERVNIPFNLRFLLCLHEIVTCVNLLGYCCIPEDNGFEETDMEHSYKFTNYLSNDSDSQKYVEIIENSTDQQTNLIDSYRYVMYKYIAYENYLEKIHLLSIINNSFDECSDFLKTLGLEECHRRFAFDESKRRETVCKILENPSVYFGLNLYETSWSKRLLIKHCPFMYFTKRDEYLVEDLLRYLGGEEVDKDILGEIYDALK